ncbi:hypothetical protein HZA99_02685 [Candidatus Woesearchaeota archaeon]|nr:hypothetical protein [Candidatus Woesearchaeota archaeon]
MKPIKQWKTASLLFLGITLVFGYPLFSVLSNWGMHDWDQHLMYEGTARESILTYHQFPLWNPWECGGDVLLANPQSSFLSLHFPLTLLFGEVIGTKLAIFLYLFLGMLGMWFVCRKLGMGDISSYFPPVLLMLSGVYAIRMTVGHTNWFHLAWIPWIFFFFLQAKENKWFIIPASCFLAVIYLGGGIHPFLIAVVLLGTFALFDTIKNWKLLHGKMLLLFLLLLVSWIPFAAIKLFPMLAVSGETLPLEQTDVESNGLLILLEALTDRSTDFGSKTYDTLDPSTGETVHWYWHEYFAYIGVIPLLLFVAAFFILFTQIWEYILAALFVVFLILSQSLFPSLWKMFQQLPLASIFHGPSRFLFAFIFFAALSLGFLLTKWEQKESVSWKYVVLAILVFVLIDLTLVNSGLFASGLYVVPDENIQSDSFSSVYGDISGYQEKQYPLFLANHGLLNCYERFLAAPAAFPRSSLSGLLYADYSGEAFLNSSKMSENISFWSPNKVVIVVSGVVSNSSDSISASDILVLNQNYISGWHAIVDGSRREVVDVNGLVGAAVTSADREVVFFYSPKWFWIGMVVSVVSIVSLVVLFVFLMKRKDKNKLDYLGTN